MSKSFIRTDRRLHEARIRRQERRNAEARRAS